MPSNHYMEEAQMLLTTASDDIPDADKIRTAIKVHYIKSIFIITIFWKKIILHIYDSQ